MALDIKYFYYGTPMAQYEYMKLALDLFPDEIIDQYDLHNFVCPNDWIYTEICKVVGADKVVQVVLINDLVREEIQGEFHVLILGHGVAVLEVLNVEHHKSGVGERYGAVGQTLRGGEAGAVGGGGARLVEYFDVDGDTNTVDPGFVRADSGNHAGIGDLAVGGGAGFGHMEP